MTTASQGHVDVIVVDDDARIRVLLEDELLARGLSTLLCGSVADLTAQLKQRRASLVLLGMRGREASPLRQLQVLRQSGCRLPVVVLSADDSDGLLIEAAVCGAQELVHKRELLRRLPQLLEQYLNAADPEQPPLKDP